MTASSASSSTISTPAFRAIASSRVRAPASTSGRLTTAIRRTGSADRGIDPAVEFGRELGSRGVDEVEKELTVSFRARQARVYDGGRLRIPFQGRLRHVSQHSRARLVRFDDAALTDLPSTGLELRLDEYEGVPAPDGET